VSDFYQVGVVSTLHQLDTRADDRDRLESELSVYGKVRPVALVLPALWSEFEGPALPSILAHLRTIRYLRRVVLSLDRADRAQFDAARKALDGVPAEVTVVWHDGPRMQKLCREIEASGLPIGQQGKGRSCWMAYGYVLATEDCEVIALHDTDILTYDPLLLARLCYPVTNPNMGYEFCKGYYPRIGDRRMHGRVTRLLMTPLIRSCYRVLGYQPFLVYLDSFRYVLAGEFAMVTELARVNRIPSDWGVEVGVLAEVYRNTSVRRVCQVALTDRYDHKHQELSAGDQPSGLLRMSIEICRSIFRTLASDGIPLNQGMFQTLLASYVRTAEDTIKRFHDDALINGLQFDRHSEEDAVATFAEAIRKASEQFLADPLGAPLIPNWNRVVSAIPGILDHIKAGVDADNR